MSLLKELRDKHQKEIDELQNNCQHPFNHPIAVRVEEGVWGRALFCKTCGKQICWTEEPKRTHEVEYIPVEWIG